MKQWHKKYGGTEFVIIGIHTPEFDNEKKLEKVIEQSKELGIEYPIVTDNKYQTWDSFKQEYWPVLYLIDKRGIIRYVRIGEGNYEETERWITTLVVEK